jgi:alpha-amylase/alpha-mannosidase (GH57 family)
MTSARSAVIHAHFYQPPREDPWLELLEREPGAAPFHDWNRRIERECYRAVVAARLPASNGRIGRIVNTLEQISFNVGPTLADWLEREAPDTWAAMLAADRVSSGRNGGHGNAIAQPFHHVILPLASRRDKTTEVRWGIADFRRRFGREPEGMWLPETAVDDETLDVLAEEGIRFTILAPHQVEELPPAGQPGKYTTSAGRSIALFLYDGPLSHDVAFGPLISDGSRWAGAMLARPLPGAEPGLVSIATDGETYGHHHRFGEMALAVALEHLSTYRETKIDNFAAFLARHPATHPVRLVEASSWSCAHGIERWRSDCGCRTKPGTTQAWRAPLRAALDWLAIGLHAAFAEEGAAFFSDPWEARETYATTGLPSHLPVRARELLEMERNALRMFTSCGWFFDDIAGLETVVCLRYAARAIELAGPGAGDLESGFRERLALAQSNDPAQGSGREVYDRRARPAHRGEVRAAAGYAALLAVDPERVRPTIGAYLVGPGEGGGLLVRHRRTGRSWSVDARAERFHSIRMRVAVSVEGDGAGTLVAEAALPEQERELIHLALRRELRRGVLSPEEDRRIAEGVLSFHRAIGLALVEQLPEDPAAPDGVDFDRIVRTLDMLALEEQTIPFDAQTRFYRLVTEGSRETRRLLAPLASRFGFSGIPEPKRR